MGSKPGGGIFSPALEFFVISPPAKGILNFWTSDHPRNGGCSWEGFREAMGSSQAAKGILNFWTTDHPRKGVVHGKASKRSWVRNLAVAFQVVMGSKPGGGIFSPPLSFSAPPQRGWFMERPPSGHGLEARRWHFKPPLEFFVIFPPSEGGSKFLDF